MKLFLLIQFLFFSLVSFGQINPRCDTTVFAHLHEVNHEWISNIELLPKQQISFENDTKRIHHHLTLVEELLRAKETVHLTEIQRMRRIALLDTLSIYSARQSFPKNTGHIKRTPYFIDASGVYCAVGYLIQKSGYQELSLTISAEHNFDYIRDIKTNGVSEWADNHGFTLDELALIQPTYEYKNNPGQQTLGGGTNGAVKRMAMDQLHNRLYIIGDFDSLNSGGKCSQFAYYESNILNCVDQNLQGNLVDLAASNGKVYVSGKIDVLGEKYSFAIYQNDSLYYCNVPGREGILATTIFPGTDDFQLEIVLENKRISEIWRLDHNNDWTHVASAKGRINSIARGEEDIVYAGAFNSFTVKKASNDLELTANNIVKRSINDNNWSVLSGQIAEEVLKVKWRENNFFFAGIDSKGHAFGLIHNGVVLALTSPWCYADMRGSSRKMTIYDFELSVDSTFTIVGDFYVGLKYEAYNEATFSYKGYKKKLAESENPLLVSMLGTITYQQNETLFCILIYNQIIYTGGALARWKNIQYIQQFKPPFMPIQVIRLSDVRGQHASNVLTLEGAAVKKAKIYDYNWNLIKKRRGNEINTKGCPSGLCYAALELEYGHKITVPFWNSVN